MGRGLNLTVFYADLNLLLINNSLDGLYGDPRDILDWSPSLWVNLIEVTNLRYLSESIGWASKKHFTLLRVKYMYHRGMLIYKIKDVHNHYALKLINRSWCELYSRLKLANSSLSYFDSFSENMLFEISNEFTTIIANMVTNMMSGQYNRSISEDIDFCIKWKENYENDQRVLSQKYISLCLIFNKYFTPYVMLFISNFLSEYMHLPDVKKTQISSGVYDFIVKKPRDSR